MLDYIYKNKVAIITTLVILALIAGIWLFMALRVDNEPVIEDTKVATTTPEVITPLEKVTEFITVVDHSEVNRLKAELEKKEAEYQKLLSDKDSLYAGREADLLQQINSLRSQLNILQAKYDKTLDAQMSELADQLEEAFNEDRGVRTRDVINRAINRAVNRINR